MFGTKNTQEKIDKWLSAPAFAVFGASSNERKFGHKCYVCLLRNNRVAYPINPREPEILGNKVYRDLASIPERVESISVITPPAVTEEIMQQAIAYGVKNVWMQPGAESMAAVKAGEQAGLNVIWGGPCLLVELGGPF